MNTAHKYVLLESNFLRKYKNIFSYLTNGSICATIYFVKIGNDEESISRMLFQRAAVWCEAAKRLGEKHFGACGRKRGGEAVFVIRTARWSRKDLMKWSACALNLGGIAEDSSFVPYTECVVARGVFCFLLLDRFCCKLPSFPLAVGQLRLREKKDDSI